MQGVVRVWSRPPEESIQERRVDFKTKLNSVSTWDPLSCPEGEQDGHLFFFCFAFTTPSLPSSSILVQITHSLHILISIFSHPSPYEGALKLHLDDQIGAILSQLIIAYNKTESTSWNFANPCIIQNQIVLIKSIFHSFVCIKLSLAGVQLIIMNTQSSHLLQQPLLSTVVTTSAMETRLCVHFVSTIW